MVTRRQSLPHCLAAILSTALAAPGAAHTLDELQSELTEREKYVQFVDYPAPDFTLLDAHGNAVSLADLRGKVVVLWFIFASCPDLCPLQSEFLAGVQDMVNQTPMRDLVRFVAITTDPTNDGSDVLGSYGEAHGLDSLNFLFLTSGSDAPDATRALAETYGLKFTLTEDGYQMHGVVTHLIDKSGRLRARAHGLKFKPTNLLVVINALSNDSH
ncbi:MAG: SCO family protein [Alphaproteobacteria bacterium]